MNGKTFWLGLCNRRERLGLTWRGRLALVLLLGLTGVLVIYNIQPFLAQTARVDTRVLVMEGWLQSYAIPVVSAEFAAHPYEKIYTTGGPVAGSDGAKNDFNTYASVGAELLKARGLPETVVQMVPCHGVGRDRTYSSALALRQWFAARGLAVHSFNLITEDAHARRSRMLFQEAFGPSVQVGVISIPDPDYDAAHWWRSSEGVRMVLAESIAYLYALLLFHPGPPN